MDWAGSPQVSPTSRLGDEYEEFKVGLVIEPQKGNGNQQQGENPGGQ